MVCALNKSIARYKYNITLCYYILLFSDIYSIYLRFQSNKNRIENEQQSKIETLKYIEHISNITLIQSDDHELSIRASSPGDTLSKPDKQATSCIRINKKRKKETGRNKKTGGCAFQANTIACNLPGHARIAVSSGFSTQSQRGRKSCFPALPYRHRISPAARCGHVSWDSFRP